MKARVTKHGEERFCIPAGAVIEFDEIDQFDNIVKGEVVYDIRFADYAGQKVYNMSLDQTYGDEAAIIVND